METKSSRRAFDGSSMELGLKKPRLMEDTIISQYRRALAELTINSKPMITNLTIIAGENLFAARSIAAIICGNILEIPSEQKLPSLYLLDSIVKNIGRDYVTYFAARLREVFCKAYRMVEPSVRSGMQRLFVTWRKVFPPQQLQLIEKELGLKTGVNGSSSGTPTDDSQAHQSSNSIHVNPKYLEARQCLQQPIRCAQKDQLNERAREKTISATYGDPEYGSDLSRGSSFRLRTGEKFNEEGFDKSWYNSANAKILNRRNEVDIKHGSQSLARRTADSDAYPLHSLANRSSTLMDMSWQNSEEEEYMWDDVSSAGKDRRPSEDSEKSGFDNQLLRLQNIKAVGLKVENEVSANSLSREDKGQSSFGDEMSSVWSEGTRHPASGRSTPDHPRGYQTYLSGPSFQSQKDSFHLETPSFGIAKTTTVSTGPIMQPRGTHRVAPPSSQSPTRQLPSSQSVLTSNFSQVVNSLTKEYRPQTLSNADPRVFQFSRSHLEPFHKNIQRESPESDSSSHSQKSAATQLSSLADTSCTVHPILPGSESPGQTSLSSLLAAVMKSGVLGSKSSVGTPLDSCDKEALSSGPRTPPASVATIQSYRNGSNPPNYPQRNVEQPESQAPKVLNNASNPVASLLNSLVAKGLISASTDESQTSAPVSSPIPLSSPNDELSAKTPDALRQSSKEEIKSLASFAFKPDVIRELNPGVISELHDDIPHQCGTCGLRLKLRLQLDRHLEWHASRNPDGKLLHSKRGWYLNSQEWISGTDSLPECGISTDPIGISTKLSSECTEVMVPADEGQCICILCGQFFEDSYDEESDKWMFKGAVYMNNSSSEGGSQGPIVHKNCNSECSHNLRLTKDIKLESET